MTRKLTPAEAFEHLKAVFPSITGISIAGGTLTAFRKHACDFQFSAHAANIDWGSAQSYKPEKRRPLTIDDLKSILDGKEVLVSHESLSYNVCVIGFVDNTIGKYVILYGGDQKPIEELLVIEK